VVVFLVFYFYNFFYLNTFPTNPSTWFYRKNCLSCDRKFKSKIEETRKVCAAINSFETVFSKNVVCRCFYMPARMQKKIKIGEGQVEKSQFLSVLTCTIGTIRYNIIKKYFFGDIII
jgi:hypothetical protein